MFPLSTADIASAYYHFGYYLPGTMCLRPRVQEDDSGYLPPRTPIGQLDAGSKSRDDENGQPAADNRRRKSQPFNLF
jgi:hypothetical protein